MAFNGSGTFSRLYNWVTDKANGVFITASRMDAEMDGFATGLSNCLTRDGQSPATANIPMGGKKITGLANGTAATDAATVGQIVAGEWLNETASLTYVSGTSLKVVGADYTSRYTPGRRIKTTNTGGTVYSTVVSATFSTDTTLVVTNDSGNLDSGLSALSYGIAAATNDSLPRKTKFSLPFNNLTLSSGTPATLGANLSVKGDWLSEWSGDANGRFTPKVAGTYLITVSGWINQSSANISLGTLFQMAVYKNGPSGSVFTWASWPFASGVGTNAMPISGQFLSTLLTTDYIYLNFAPGSFTGSPIFQHSFTIERIA